MDLESHCAHTIKELGDAFSEIHRWLDAFAKDYSMIFYCQDTTQIDHRKHRHHKEGIEEAVKEFEHKYPKDIIRKVCEIHIRDDYDGYLPSKKDFEDSEFLKKHHY